MTPRKCCIRYADQLGRSLLAFRQRMFARTLDALESDDVRPKLKALTLELAFGANDASMVKRATEADGG